MTEPDRSRPGNRRGQSSKSQQPFEVAGDEYQAPFQMPNKKANNEANNENEEDGINEADATAFASSPYFDDQEAKEAFEWAQSQQEAGIDGESSGNAANGTGVEIGRRRRRDSQVGSYDEGGSIFDGPGAGAVPSSVSSMRHEMARPELGRRSSRTSRRRISMEGRSPRRTRKLSSASAQSDAVTLSSERSVSPDSVAGRRKPASQRSGSAYRFGRRKRVPEDGELTGSSQPKGMLGSILASFRGDRGDDDDDDARSRRSSSRPLLSRRRSSGSVISSRGGRSDAGHDDDDEDDDDLDNSRGWSDDDYGFDDEDEDENSYNTSDEDDGSNRNGILPSAFGTLSGAVDPVFGDTRFSTDHPPEDELDAELGGRDLEAGEGSGFGRSEGDLRSGSHAQGASAYAAAARKELSFLDKSSKSRQQVYLTEEDTLIRFTGYRTLVVNQIIYSIVCCITLGIVYLIGRWLPTFRLKYVCKEVEFENAEFIMVENQWGDLHKEKITTIPFARPLATVFPHSSREPPATQAEYQAAPTINLPPELVNKSNAPSKAASAKSSIVNGGAPTNSNGNGSAADASASGALPMLSGVQTEQLMDLSFFDYRYTRFALHPPTGRLRMVKDWRDPLWTSLGAINNGISFDAEKDRTTIFGKNLIEIQAKSTWQLLVDEVLHPFYMFQIVSILLWSIDDYYYYAFCIAVISLASICTTLIETRQTVNRMREMSRFTCEVRVLREGNWQVLDSGDLVPGDVYDVAEPGLLLFPADSVLLSGDAIVNESMLTGESVPVSKVPLTTPSMVGLHAGRH